MAIRITDVMLPPRSDNSLSGLRIYSTHGYVDLVSHAQVIAALGHTGIAFLPTTDRNTAHLRHFLVGRIARVDKSRCKTTPYFITLFQQKRLFTLKWKKGAHNA